jgi:hypothetical protein
MKLGDPERGFERKRSAYLPDEGQWIVQAQEATRTWDLPNANHDRPELCSTAAVAGATVGPSGETDGAGSNALTNRLCTLSW